MVQNRIKELIFNTRSEAADVLDKLNDLIIDYGEASLVDYYELCGLINNSLDDHNYGWLSVKEASIWKVRDGYVIYFPPIKRINNDPKMAGADIDGDKPVRNPGMETLIDKEIVLAIPNEDSLTGPFTFLPKEVLCSSYVNSVGKKIDFCGMVKTIKSVEITTDKILIKLV